MIQGNADRALLASMAATIHAKGATFVSVDDAVERALRILERVDVVMKVLHDEYQEHRPPIPTGDPWVQLRQS